MRHSHLLLLFAVSTGPLSAQQIIETFTYPDGPVVPGWTQRSGSWVIKSNRLAKTNVATTHYISKDGTNFLNGVLDLEVFCSQTTGLQLAGAVMRMPAAAVSPSVYGKLQDNASAVNDFDIAYLYDGSTATTGAVSPGVTTANIRLIVLGTTATFLIDRDKNGIYDITVTRAVASAAAAGQLACTAYRDTEMDNLKFYDGVLMEQSTPKIGTTYNMRFSTPAPQNTLWAAAFSLSNTGIPLGSRAVPLGFDPLLNLTLGNAGALGLSGLTNASGEGTLAFPIPSNPALVGFAFYAAAFTVDGSMPFSIGVISQDVRVVIVP